MPSAWEAIKSKNRRLKPRSKVDLPAIVSLIDKEHVKSQWPSVPAHARDVSSQGLALIMPTMFAGCYDLSSIDHVLKIILAISNEVRIEMYARLMYFEILTQDEMEEGYLAKVEIEGMSAEDRLLYDEFLERLNNA